MNFDLRRIAVWLLIAAIHVVVTLQALGPLVLCVAEGHVGIERRHTASHDGDPVAAATTPQAGVSPSDVGCDDLQLAASAMLLTLRDRLLSVDDIPPLLPAAVVLLPTSPPSTVPLIDVVDTGAKAASVRTLSLRATILLV